MLLGVASASGRRRSNSGPRESHRRIRRLSGCTRFVPAPPPRSSGQVRAKKLGAESGESKSEFGALRVSGCTLRPTRCRPCGGCHLRRRTNLSRSLDGHARSPNSHRGAVKPTARRNGRSVPSRCLSEPRRRLTSSRRGSTPVGVVPGRRGAVLSRCSVALARMGRRRSGPPAVKHRSPYASATPTRACRSPLA